jgi:2,4-dichlorophenol 6-monooxygenase
MQTIEVPVLIVGGGGCGLALSIFLADLGVKYHTVEKNAQTTDHPRAHILNTRTMEIMLQHGVADEIYRQGTPTSGMERISFRTSLGGDGPLDRRLIGNLDGYGGGALKERYEKDSMCRATNLPLMQLEPLLRAVAESRAPGQIHRTRHCRDRRHKGTRPGGADVQAPARQHGHRELLNRPRLRPGDQG